MTKLDKLIQELCPDGVIYRNVSDVAEVSIGEFVHKSKQNPDGKYPVYNGGTSNTGYYDDYNRTANKIIISARGANAGFVNRVFTNYWSGNSCYTVDITDKNLDWNFAFYWFKSNELSLLGEQQKGGIPAVSKKQVERFRIPVPPLPVQREIVRILDTFTELTAELTARKQQYAYYRDNLLTFRVDITRKSLDELCTISAAGDAPKDALSLTKTAEYQIPVISNGIGENAFYGYTDKPKITEPAVTVAARGTIGYAEYRDYPYYPIIRLLSVIPKNTAVLATKYLYYCMQGKKYNVPLGGIPQLTAPELKKVVIPVPPLPVQQRIVTVLDNFDAICSDLNIGLPAEIEARKKQYEFYRDQLLTFAAQDEIVLTDRQTDRQTDRRV